MYPHLKIDLDKIEDNTRTIVGLCREHGIGVTGVTKCVCGHPEIAKAMLRGGVIAIGDSRLENLHRLQAAGVDTRYELIRLPPLTGAGEVVGAAGMSLNSELAVLEALSRAAVERGTVHEVTLMVDLGDLREGIWPDDLVPFVREALGLEGIRIGGIGANLGCFAGLVPTQENMERLVELAEEVENTLGIELARISGFNSSGLELIASGKSPPRVNHARIGEAILFGRETTHRRPWPGTFQDAFVLTAEILELKKKPSLPMGERAEDAFGKRPVFEDRGEVTRALLNVGREDVDVEGVTSCDDRLTVLGASSGYLALDVTLEEEIAVGEELSFFLSYSALLRAMTSEYVKKDLFRDDALCGDGD